MGLEVEGTMTVPPESHCPILYSAGLRRYATLTIMP